MKVLPPGAASTRSVWTVDLAYGLKNTGFDNFFCTTINNCVDPSHAELGFYSSGFSDDERRVNELITTAAENGVVIHEESVSEEDLRAARAARKRQTSTAESDQACRKVLTKSRSERSPTACLWTFCSATRRCS